MSSLEFLFLGIYVFQWFEALEAIMVPQLVRTKRNHSSGFQHFFHSPEKRIPPVQFFIGIQKSRFIRMLKKVLDSFIDIGGRAYFIQEECFLSLSLPLSCPQTLSFALVQPISCFLCSFFSSVFNICLLSLYLWFFLALQFCHFIFLNILFSLFRTSQSNMYYYLSEYITLTL